MRWQHDKRLNLTQHQVVGLLAYKHLLHLVIIGFLQFQMKLMQLCLHQIHQQSRILQVKQVVKTDTFSLAASSTNQRIDITGLTIDITPSSASNKILVDYRVKLYGHCKWSLQSNDPFNERFFRYLYWRSRFWIN